MNCVKRTAKCICRKPRFLYDGPILFVMFSFFVLYYFFFVRQIFFNGELALIKQFVFICVIFCLSVMHIVRTGLCKRALSPIDMEFLPLNFYEGKMHSI